MERMAMLGVGWIVVGVVVLALPSVGALAVVIGVALVAEGLIEVVRTLAGRQPSERAAALVGGLASIVLGILALAWPLARYHHLFGGGAVRGAHGAVRRLAS